MCGWQRTATIKLQTSYSFLILMPFFSFSARSVFNTHWILIHILFFDGVSWQQSATTIVQRHIHFELMMHGIRTMNQKSCVHFVRAFCFAFCHRNRGRSSFLLMPWWINAEMHNVWDLQCNRESDKCYHAHIAQQNFLSPVTVAGRHFHFEWQKNLFTKKEKKIDKLLKRIAVALVSGFSFCFFF